MVITLTGEENKTAVTLERSRIPLTCLSSAREPWLQLTTTAYIWNYCSLAPPHCEAGQLSSKCSSFFLSLSVSLIPIASCQDQYQGFQLPLHQNTQKPQKLDQGNASCGKQNMVGANLPADKEAAELPSRRLAIFYAPSTQWKICCNCQLYSLPHTFMLS